MLDLFEEFRVNLVFRTHSLCKKLQTVPLPVQKWEKKPPSQQLSEPAQRSNSIDGTFEQQKKERIIKQHSYFEVLKELALYGKSTCICWYQCRFSYIVERRKHDSILDFFVFLLPCFVQSIVCFGIASPSKRRKQPFRRCGVRDTGSKGNS